MEPGSQNAYVKLEAILKHLDSKRVADRQAAERALQGMGAEVVGPLLEIIAREARKRRARKHLSARRHPGNSPGRAAGEIEP